MAKFKVEFRGYAFATATVEADNEDDAAEIAFADGFPELCAGCSGWGKEWTLTIPDDPACWEYTEVRDAE